MALWRVAPHRLPLRPLRHSRGRGQSAAGRPAVRPGPPAPGACRRSQRPGAPPRVAAPSSVAREPRAATLASRGSSQRIRGSSACAAAALAFAPPHVRDRAAAG